MILPRSEPALRQLLQALQADASIAAWRSCGANLDASGCGDVVADAIWITEVWESQESHGASLSLPSVRSAIERGKPLIARFDESFVTEPVGGVGLRNVSRDR